MFGLKRLTGAKPFHQAVWFLSRLFSHVSSTKLQSSTFRAFDRLLDNYQAQTGISDSTSTAEEQEITAFLTSVYATQTFQTMKNFLQSKGGSYFFVSFLTMCLQSTCMHDIVPFFSVFITVPPIHLVFHTRT